MNQTEIIVEFDEAGKPTIEVQGHSGPGCKDLTKAIEKALGAVVGDEKKPEFFKRAEQRQTARR